jgi:hypothetical protein
MSGAEDLAGGHGRGDVDPGGTGECARATLTMYRNSTSAAK